MRSSQAHAARWALCHGAHWRRIMALLRPCHSALWSCRKPCLALCHAQCRKPLCHDTKFVWQHTPLPRALRLISCALSCVSQRSWAMSQGTAAPYRSLTASYCHTKVAPSHDTNHCIATHPMARPRARALLAPARMPAVSWLYWLCRGAVSWGCWPCRGPLLHAPAALCHDTIYSIVTQTRKMGSSPFQSHLHLCFFSLFQLLQDHNFFFSCL